MTSLMRAVWLEDQHLRVRDDLPVPVPLENDALVQVLRAGICNTDLELVRGYYPYRGVMGHEFVGVVARGPDELVGQRVVGEINVACKDCPACHRGHPNHCDNRTVLGIVGRDGAFAEYLTLPVDNLHVVPDNVSTDAATFTEPLAAALGIQQQVELLPGDRVLVVGDGKLGNLIAQTVALCECDLLVAGRHANKLALLSARGIVGVPSDRVERAAFDVAVECTGNAEGLACALQALRPRGRLIMKSTYAGALTVDASRIVVNELTLVGSRCGPFGPALELLESGHVSVEPLIDGRYSLDDGLVALEHAQRPGALKVLFDIG